ncbi:SusC/RagA family TonB-linked outer membrane protein [Pedobacter rhizosphaerae]|uniref:TonB-linked outer membrane protein, SusC/RagA family n=1 Tax=Pedobacter rhizosphaerae TaxID=390241 RepID=A0A1H9R8T0_9SPHI|nr:SusC/RagA family TonB-linked outer membrane protein [Pedobacter rhizosphaerae]SER69078.1 TonB-linked outer membrane protein, SusC/RagA family [Pedobacter rhizosphaerae]
MKKLVLSLFLFLYWGLSLTHAQSKNITGKVIADNDGLPIPGVSVLIKGTKKATVTGADGKFTISASPGDILQLSYIGFITQDVPVGNQAVLNVKLITDAQTLSEVTVTTALGIKRKPKEIGYATQQVTGKALTSSRPTNLATGLSGKVAGLQISQANNQIDAGDQVRVVLRGNRSFQGNNQALLVLDGIIVPLNQLNSINPNDIESVNILKGANAAALYGSDAANGVMIVSTKRGSADGGSVSYTNSTLMNRLSYFPKMQTEFGGGTTQDDFGFGQYTPFENQTFGDRFDGSLRPVGRILQDGTYQMVPYTYKDGEKESFFETGIDEQNDISYSGGNENGTTYINVQRVNSKGYVPGDKSNRTAFRINGTRKIGKFLADYSFNYTQRNYDKSTNQVYNNVINTPGNIPLTEYSDLDSKYGNPNDFYNDYYISPYFGLKQYRNKERRDDLLGNLSLTYKPVDWLSLMARGGLSTKNSQGKDFNYAYTYSDFAHDSGKGVAATQYNRSSVRDYNEFESRYTGDFLATATKTFNQFKFTLIGGAQVIQKNYKYITAQGNNLVVDNLFNLSNRTGEIVGSELERNSRQLAVFGDLTATYNDFLTVHVSGRNEWDSRLNSNNRVFFYPAVDIAATLTDVIPALKESKVISNLKLRGGISKVSAVQVDPYKLISTINPASGFPYGNTAGYTVDNQINDPNLKPENTLSKELGFDIGFLNNRITLETSVYLQNTKNQQIVNGIDLSASTGFTTAVINTGESENKGFEFSLNAAPVIGLSNGFRWNVGINYSYNTNKVLGLYGDLSQLGLGDNNYVVLGQSFPSLQVSTYQTDPQGRVIVDANTGLPIASPINKDFGQTNPNHILGVNTSFTFKNFTLSGVAEYRSGNVFYSGMASTLDFSGISYTSAQAGRERFIYPNSVIQTSPGVFVPNTNVTTIQGNGSFWSDGIRTNTASNYVSSAAFWKIRELSLAYQVPAQWLGAHASFIKNASIALVGRNLFMFRPSDNIYTDPEINVGTGNAQGVNNLNQTPPTRIYGFTATIGF